jgi:hypothetical protein
MHSNALFSEKRMWIFGFTVGVLPGMCDTEGYGCLAHMVVGQIAVHVISTG